MNLSDRNNWNDLRSSNKCGMGHRCTVVGSPGGGHEGVLGIFGKIILSGCLVL
jgi:hypothetical protein